MGDHTMDHDRCCNESAETDLEKARPRDERQEARRLRQNITGDHACPEHPQRGGCDECADALVSLIDSVCEQRDGASRLLADMLLCSRHRGQPSKDPHCAFCQRDRAMKERDSLKEQLDESQAIIRRVHQALGESEHSDHESLPDVVSQVYGAMRNLRERVRALKEQLDLLREKWDQMESYGFYSPSVVFKRIEHETKKLKEQLAGAHVERCDCHRKGVKKCDECGAWHLSEGMESYIDPRCAEMRKAK